VAENTGLSSEGLRTTGGKAPAKELVGRDSGDRPPEIVAAGHENEKNSDALDTGWGACCYNSRGSKPGAVPGRSKWEMSAQ
jgi:hypothetical protein